MISYERFSVPEVRDLAWVVHSEPLITGRDVPEFTLEFDEQELRELDADPDPLLTFLKEHKKSNRLGWYFENLVHYALLHMDSVQQCHESVVVRSDTETIGEFDFLIHSNGQWNHLEVAVKFYLATTFENKRLYVGPNAKDRLDIKLNHMFGHQLNLSKDIRAADTLNGLGVKSPSPAWILKGYVFFPLHMSLPETTEDLSSFAKKGWWLHQSSLQEYFSDERLLSVLSKDRWLSPHICAEEELTTVTQVSLAMGSNRLSPPFMLLQMREEEGVFYEETRIMVVEDSWPGMQV